RKVQASTTVNLGKGANLLVSTSVFNTGGASQLYFPEFNSPETNFGWARNVDGSKGYHALANLTWGNWDILAVAADRVKGQPISWGETVFGDRGTRAEDSRGFLDVSYTKQLSSDRRINWRTSYDEYRYRGTYHYVPAEPGGPIEDNREHDYGDWIGSR